MNKSNIPTPSRISLTRRLEPRCDVLWGVRGHPLGREVGLDGLLPGAHAVDPGHAELILNALLQAGDLLVLDLAVGDLEVEMKLNVDIMSTQ